MNVANKLQQFGLTEKETKIYIALLGLEKAVVSDIAKKSGINRSTAYIILESLKEQRLVNVSERNNVQYFSAAPPKKFVDIATDKMTEAKARTEIAKSIVEALKDSYQGVGDRPQLVVYEGLDGLQNALTDIGSPKKGATYDMIKDILMDGKKEGTMYKFSKDGKHFTADLKEEYCYILEGVA